MTLGVVTIRFVALLVLLAAACDYCAFDLWDPSAPMDSAGREAIAAPFSHTTAPTMLRATSAPDDRCLGCSPWIAPKRPVVLRAHVTTPVTQGVRASIPIGDPLRIERPPRA